MVLGTLQLIVEQLESVMHFSNLMFKIFDVQLHLVLTHIPVCRWKKQFINSNEGSVGFEQLWSAHWPITKTLLLEISLHTNNTQTWSKLKRNQCLYPLFPMDGQ